MALEKEKHKRKSDNSIVGLLVLLFVVLAVLTSFISREGMPQIEAENALSEKEPTVELFPMRSSEEKHIWKAVYDNNLSALSTLLDNNTHYFGQDDEKINYSKLGEAFLNSLVSSQTVNYMYQHGLKLNDLKPVAISWEAKQFFEDNDINVTNLDAVYLPQDIQTKLAEYDLDLSYYRNKNIDEYYIAELAEKLPSERVVQTLLWLLDHGYEPEPTALGYMFAKLLERKDIMIDASLVQKFSKRGLRFSMSEKDNMVHKKYNAYVAIVALFFTGRMDDNSLISALREQGMLINSSNYSDRTILSSICHADDDIVEAHEQGIINLLNQGLVVGGKSLEGCPKNRLVLLKELGNAKSSQSLEYYLARPEKSTMSKIQSGINSPMGMVVSVYAIGLALLFVLFIFLAVLLIRRSNKK